jgi:signal transduction histidine kinase
VQPETKFMKSNHPLPLTEYDLPFSAESGNENPYASNNDLTAKKSSLRLVWESEQAATPATKTDFLERLAAIVSEAQDAERKHIGQELHDNVNQVLMSVKLFAEMMHPETEKDAKLQQRIIDYVVMSINEIRKLSGELVVASKKEKSFVCNVNSLVDDLLLSTNMKIEFNYSGEIECLCQEVKTTLFRIIQEQMNNVVKYSQAERVWIDLGYCNNKAKLFIKDDGIGFDSRKDNHGIGFANIADRAQSHGGTMYLQSAPDKGCILSVNIPVA